VEQIRKGFLIFSFINVIILLVEQLIADFDTLLATIVAALELTIAQAVCCCFGLVIIFVLITVMVLFNHSTLHEFLHFVSFNLSQ